MASLNNLVFDSGLDYLTDNVDYLYICSAEPATYAEAATTYALGEKAAPTVGAAGDRTGGGRKVSVTAIEDGSVTGSDTATHWALTYNGDTLLATGSLAAPQAVVSGNTFSLAGFDIGIPDPA